MKRVEFGLMLLGLGFAACGKSDGPAAHEDPGQPPRIESVAAVAGTVVDSAGDPVQGADVSVKSFWFPEPPAPHHEIPCEASGLGTAETQTNAAGRFQVVVKGNPSELDGCGIVIVRTDEEHSDTISDIPLRFRFSPSETTNVHVIIP